MVEPVKKSLTNEYLVDTLEFSEPEFIYNVVVGCYSINKLKLAKRFKNKLNRNGFKANIYISKDSKYYRVITLTTEDEKLALKMLRKSRREIDHGSWLYLYNKQ